MVLSARSEALGMVRMYPVIRARGPVWARGMVRGMAAAAVIGWPACLGWSWPPRGGPPHPPCPLPQLLPMGSSRLSFPGPCPPRWRHPCPRPRKPIVARPVGGSEARPAVGSWSVRRRPVSALSPPRESRSWWVARGESFRPTRLCSSVRPTVSGTTPGASRLPQWMFQAGVSGPARPPTCRPSPPTGRSSPPLHPSRTTRRGRPGRAWSWRCSNRVRRVSPAWSYRQARGVPSCHAPSRGFAVSAELMWPM